MENFKKYEFTESGILINAATKKPVNKISGKNAYCLYNNQGKRETVSSESVAKWFSTWALKNIPSIENGGLVEGVPEPKRRSIPDQHVKEIYLAEGKTKDIAKNYGIPASSVSKIRNNQSHTKITKQCN